MQVAREMKMGIPMMPKTAMNFNAIKLNAAGMQHSRVIVSQPSMRPSFQAQGPVITNIACKKLHVAFTVLSSTCMLTQKRRYLCSSSSTAMVLCKQEHW